MVKVRDLIKYSEFIKADGFDDLKPEVTITLPTFRRGDNGLLKKSVESLLDQTFSNFELIITDDGSTDSTAKILDEFMKKDSRIAIIKHTKNVGLPAVSAMETFLLARSNKFFYGFDDCEYNPRAIEILYNYMKDNPDAKIVHGIAEAKQLNSNNTFVGDKSFEYSNLLIANCIPNSAVIVDREVIETVGYCDPHVSMIRHCDWDLWLRVAMEFKVHSVKSVLVYEKGCSEADSLGNSFPQYWELIQEWLKKISRNDRLKPNAFLDYEIDWKPENLPNVCKAQIDRLLKNNFSDKFWSVEVDDEYLNMKFITFLIRGEIPSTGLLLNTLSKEVRDKISIMLMGEFRKDMHATLSRSKAIIFSREIDILTLTYANLCRAYGIPYYYYTDDNLFDIGWTPKTEENFNFIRGAKACIVSSEALIDYFKENNLHDKFYLCVPAISQMQKQDLIVNLDKYKNSKQINFLYASNHRFDGVLKMKDVFISLAKKYFIKYYIFFQGEQPNEMNEFNEICMQNNIEVEFLSPVSDHRDFIKKISALNIHFIIHPQSFDNQWFLINHKYKTLNFLLNAYLSSSLIFVPNLEPYSRLKNQGLVSDLLYDDSNEIYNKVDKVMEEFEYAKNLYSALENYCLTNFDVKINEKMFTDIWNELQ